MKQGQAEAMRYAREHGCRPVISLEQLDLDIQQLHDAIHKRKRKGGELPLRNALKIWELWTGSKHKLSAVI
jgi:hypothetical protein